MNRPFHIRKYIQEHLSLYIFVSVLFLTGVIFGALLVNALTLEQKQHLGQFLGSFLHTVDQGMGEENLQFFWQSYAMHIKWVLLIWVLGLSVIGLPLVLILDFLKGVLIGFTVGYMVSEMAWDGMLLALASVAPQNLILIPLILICSVTAISFSLYMVKNRFLQRRGAVYPTFLSYTLTMLIFAAVALAVSLFETYASPVLLQWVAPRLL